MSLCKEVLGVLNHCNPQGPSLGVLSATLLEWVRASAASILLLPLLVGACQGLASVTHMAQLTEACIEAFFCNGKLDYKHTHPHPK